ncbi:MAG: ABC transporter transmembrane domain-containing protein [Hyphomonadaceae bacterium]
MTNTTNSQEDPVRDSFRDMHRVFIGVAGFSLFTSMLMLTGPLYMLQVYDRVLASASVHTLVALTILILVLYAGFAVLDWVRNSILSRVGSRFEDVLGDRTLIATIKDKLHDPGRGSDKPIRDLRTLRKFFGSPAVTAMFDAPFSIMFLLVIFMIHWWYGVLALGGGFVLVGIAFLNQSVSHKSVRDSEVLEMAAQARVSEISQNAEIIEALGLGDRVRKKWRDEFDRSDAALVASSSLLSRFASGTKAFRLFLQSSVLGVGAYLSILGISTPGEMIAASILTGRAIGPVEQLVGQWRSVSSARAAWNSLREALLGRPSSGNSMALPAVRGEIEFEGVSAGPPGAQKPFLLQLSFKIAVGDIVGLIGPSAVGKIVFGSNSDGNMGRANRHGPHRRG